MGSCGHAQVEVVAEHHNHERTGPLPNSQDEAVAKRQTQVRARQLRKIHTQEEAVDKHNDNHTPGQKDAIADHLALRGAT